MIFALAVLLGFQLAGETLTRAFDLPLPGPVIGMVMLIGAVFLRPSLATRMRETTDGLLAHLSLLFVPAGVGVISHASVLGDSALALMVALIVSTALAIAAGALTFTLVARLSGGDSQ